MPEIYVDGERQPHPIEPHPKAGGAAFPVSGEYMTVFGMSLRDWFAGQALTGILAQAPKADIAAEFARKAYVVADAMLRAREEI